MFDWIMGAVDVRCLALSLVQMEQVRGHKLHRPGERTPLIIAVLFG